MSQDHEFRQEIALLGVDRKVIDVLDATNAFMLDLADLERRYGRQVAYVEVHGFERVNGRDLGRLFRDAVIGS